jgi:hypothetical protein
MLGNAVLGTRVRAITTLRQTLREKSSVAVSSKAIALHDTDKVYLQKNCAPEERLEDVKTHTGQVKIMHSYFAVLKIIRIFFSACRNGIKMTTVS